MLGRRAIEREPDVVKGRPAHEQGALAGDRTDASQAVVPLVERMLDTLGVGALVIDASGAVLLQNRTIRLMLGVDERGILDLADLDPADRRRADGRSFTRDELPVVRALRRGEVVSGEDLWITRPDGRTIHATADAMPIRDRDGEIAAAIVALVDVGEQRRREQRQALLADLAGLVDRAGDPDAVVMTAVAALVPRVADIALVALDDDGGLRPAVVATGEGGPRRAGDGPRLTLEHADGPRRFAISSPGDAEPLLPAAVVGAAHRDAVRQALAVPLLARGRRLGVLVVGTTAVHDALPDDDLVGAVAAHVAAALLHARLHREALEQRSRAETFERLAADLARATTPEEVASAVAVNGEAALGATLMTVCLRVAGTTRCRFVHGPGVPADMAARWVDVHLDAPYPLTAAIRGDEVIVVPSRDALESAWPEFARLATTVASVSLPLHDTDGSVVGALALAFDQPQEFDAERLATYATTAELCEQALSRSLLHERARRDAAVLDTLFSASPLGIGLFDEQLRFIRVNDALAEMNGVPAAEHAGRSVAAIAPDLTQQALEVLRRVLTTRSPLLHVEISGETAARPGEQRQWDESFYPVVTPDGTIVGMGAIVEEVTDRRRAEARATLQHRFTQRLARASTVDDVVRAVGTIDDPVAGASAVELWLVEADTRRLRLERVWPASASTNVDRPARETSPRFADAAAGDVLVASATLPLRSPRGHIGVLRLTWPGAHAFETDERRFLVTVADLAASALERARLHDADRNLALQVQQLLLTPGLPDVPGARLSARYLPASSAPNVGGDWYEVLQLGDGRLGCVVGDVAGSGLAASAVMARVRHALAAVAQDRSSPRAVLRATNRYLVGSGHPLELVTASYVVVDPVRRTLCWSNAGHLPAALVDAQGGVQLLDAVHGPPLGVADVEYGESDLSYAGAATLVLYTDGLIERRGESLDDGLARLRAALADAPPDRELLADHLIATLAETGGGVDDTAVLVVDLPARRSLHLALAADPRTVRSARRDVDAWLAEGGVGVDERNDVILAVSEATANAVRHAYAGGEGEVLIDAVHEGSRVELVVSDRGQWREPPAGHDGLGLILLGRLTASVTVERSAHGTTVRLRFDLTPDASAETEPA